MRRLAAALLQADILPASPVNPADRLGVYEARADIYLGLLLAPDRVQAVLEREVADVVSTSSRPVLAYVVPRLLQLDAWLRPRYGEVSEFEVEPDFDLRAVCDALDAMQMPSMDAFDGSLRRVRMRSPGGLGVVLRSPDGGHWLQARALPETDDAPLAGPSGAGAGPPALITLSQS
jgi:hypothetical protein